MKVYRISLFVVAGLVFLTALSSLAIPAVFLLVIRILVTVLAIFSIFYHPDLSRIAVVNLLLAAFVFNPFLAMEFPEPSGRIIALATVVGFIRLGTSLTSVIQKNSND